jgi:tetratricopeptide (TPR) repeat protein
MSGTNRTKLVALWFVPVLMAVTIALSCSAGGGQQDTSEDLAVKVAALIHNGKFDSAKVLLDTIAVNTGNVFGPTSPEYVTVLESIGECLLYERHFAEAESVALSIIAIPYSESLNRAKVRAYRLLGNVYWNTDEVDLSLDYLKRGRILAIDSFGAADSMAIKITGDIVETHLTSLQEDSAMKYADQYLQSTSLRPEYPDSVILVWLGFISLLYSDHGRCSEAESVLAKVLDKPNVNRPENRAFLAEAKLLIGTCRVESGNLKDAIEYYEPALALARIVYSADTARLIPFIRWYGYALLSTKRLHEADTLYNELLPLCYSDTSRTPKFLSMVLDEKAKIVEALGRKAEAAMLRARADSTLAAGHSR